jgi:hypothetical protein
MKSLFSYPSQRRGALFRALARGEGTNPRADGAKRRVRILIPPAIYTRGNESISEV